MLSGLFGDPYAHSLEGATLPPSESATIPLRDNTTLGVLATLLGPYHETLLTVPWYRKLLGYSIDHSPFNLVQDPTGCFTPVFDPNYFSPVINPAASPGERQRLGVMLVHDLVHVAIGDMAPFTKAELDEARTQLLQGNYSWKPERTPDEQHAVKTSYVRGLLAFECEAFLMSHLVMPFSLGPDATRGLFGDEELAKIMESGEISLPALAERVRDFYLDPHQPMPALSMSPEVEEVLKRSWRRAQADLALSEHRFERVSFSSSRDGNHGIRAWCYLFLEKSTPVDDVDSHLTLAIERIEGWEPLHADNIYLINAYLDAHYRNGPMLREIVGGTEYYNGRELFLAYERDRKERDALVATWRKGERPISEITTRAMEYPFPLPQRVPPLENFHFPYLGRTLATADVVQYALENFKTPLDISFLIRSYFGKESGFFKDEVPLPHKPGEGLGMLQALQNARDRRFSGLESYLTASDSEILALAKGEPCTVTPLPGLPQLPHLLVYGLEQLGIVHAIETERNDNFSTEPDDSKLAIMETIATELLRNMVYRMTVASSGRTSFLATYPIVEASFGNRPDGGGERWRDREAQAAVGLWMETIVRPAFGLEDDASREISSVLGRFAPALASDIFRAYYVYGMDPQEYFAQVRDAGQPNTEVPPLTAEESSRLRSSMGVRYDTYHFKRGALSLMTDRRVHFAISSMVAEFRKALQGGQFQYHTNYNLLFHRLAPRALKELNTLSEMSTSILAFGMHGLNEWGSRVGGASVLQTAEYVLDHAEQTIEHLEVMCRLARSISGIMRNSFGITPGVADWYRQIARLAIEVENFSPLVRMSLSELFGVVTPVVGNWEDVRPTGPQTDPVVIAQLDAMSERIGALVGFTPDLVGRRFA